MQEGSYLENKFRVEPDTRIMPWKQLFPVPLLTISESYDCKIVSLFFQIQRLDKNKKKFALSMVESMLDNLAGL